MERLVVSYTHLFLRHVKEIPEHCPLDGLMAGGRGQAPHIPVVIPQLHGKHVAEFEGRGDCVFII